MKPEDLNLFDILERDEPRWDDDVLEPVRYRVEEDWWPDDTRYLVLVRRGAYGTFINSLRLDQVDLSDFRRVSS